MTLNLSLNPTSEARLRELAEQAGTDVNAYVLQLIETYTELSEAPSNNSPQSRARPVGLAKGTFEVSPGFFDPLPDDLLEAFGNQGLPC